MMPRWLCVHLILPALVLAVIWFIVAILFA